ncbi:MAG: phosphoribosylanthranilate isomerase [ANME-2 cluster archaeon]|nr:phosphoribosylanthranilate isomerase [ANME-2 cluster archaeon]
MQKPAGCQMLIKNSIPVPRIKICGMSDRISVRMAVHHGADAVGFITEVPVDTPRNIARKTARDLVACTPPFVTSVMVCMPDDPAQAVELIDCVRPDAVQIHNYLTVEELNTIKKATRVKLIKTVPVDPDTDIGNTIAYISRLQHTVDAILLDTNIGGRTGGTGAVHDWTISQAITASSPLPVILAGGLKPENVAEAVRTVRPYAVDTASGVETGGSKDENKVKTFIRQVKGHYHE